MAMLQPTPLQSLFVDGMDEDQIWAQLELRSKNVCSTLEYALEATGEEMEEESEGEGAPGKKARLDEEEEDEEDMDELDGMDDVDGLVDSDETEDEEDEGEDEDEELEESDDEDLGESVTELRDPSPDDEESRPTLFSKIQSAMKKTEKTKKRGGHPELDDGFFNLADFNAESERAEARKVSRGRLGGSEEEEEESGEDEEIDIFKAVDDDVEVAGDGEGDWRRFSCAIFELTTLQNLLIRTFSNLHRAPLQ
jgi:U3 small nucleolar RNA-associated protein MPP10